MAGRPRLDPEVRDARKRARARARCRRWMALYPEIRMLEAARKRARERGTPCTITRADIQIPETCPILGIPLLRATGRSSASDSSSSLDCIDSHLGYVPGNVWVISWRVKVDQERCNAPRTRSDSGWGMLSPTNPQPNPRSPYHQTLSKRSRHFSTTAERGTHSEIHRTSTHRDRQVLQQGLQG